MPDTGAWIAQETTSGPEGLQDALRLLYALRCTPAPGADQPAGPHGPAAGGLLAEASAGLTTVVMKLAAITAELGRSDDAVRDPVAAALLAEVGHGLGRAEDAAMALLVSYRTEDGSGWKDSG